MAGTREAELLLERLERLDCLVRGSSNLLEREGQGDVGRHNIHVSVTERIRNLSAALQPLGPITSSLPGKPCLRYNAMLLEYILRPQATAKPAPVVPDSCRDFIPSRHLFSALDSRAALGILH